MKVANIIIEGENIRDIIDILYNHKDASMEPKNLLETLAESTIKKIKEKISKPFKR